MHAVSTFWLCSDQVSTAEYLECQSHNEASCSATSLVRTSRRKASSSVAQWETIPGLKPWTEQWHFRFWELTVKIKRRNLFHRWFRNCLNMQLNTFSQNKIIVMNWCIPENGVALCIKKASNASCFNYVPRYERLTRNIWNRKSCYCCWQYAGRSDLVAAAVGGRIAVLPVYISLSPWIILLNISGSDH